MIIMKNYLLLLAALFTSSGAMAVSPRPAESHHASHFSVNVGPEWLNNQPDPRFKLLKKTTSNQEASDDARFRAEAEAAAPVFTVTPAITCNEELGEKPMVMQLALRHGGRWAEQAMVFGPNPEDCMPWQLTEGVYDFVFVVSSPRGVIIIGRPDVQISGDCTVEANTTEATNHIKPHFLFPGNKEIVITAMNSEGGIAKKGNLLAGDISLHITPKTLNSSISFNTTLNAFVDENGQYSDSWNYTDLWINDCDFLNIDFVFFGFEDGGNCVLSAIKAKDVKDSNPSNAAIPYQDYYTTTPSAIQLKGLSEGIAFCNVGFNFNYLSKWLSSTSYAIMGNLDCNPGKLSFSIDTSDGVDILPRFDRVVCYDEEADMSLEIEGPVATPANGGLMACGLDFWYRDWFAGYEVPKHDEALQMYLPEEGELALGRFMPTLVYLHDEEVVSVSFMGPAGDNRYLVDRPFSKITVKNGGETVCDNFDKLNSMLVDENYDTIEFKGDWDVEIVDENLVVDGLEGKSTLNLHYGAGAEIPAIPGYAVNGGDNMPGSPMVTDAANATLTVQAGMFSFTSRFEEELIGWTKYWTGNAPKEFTMEYAPYQSGDFTPMEFETSAATHGYMASKGMNYTAALSQVDKPSATMWYDLRLKVTGDDGAEATEVISPAFCIGKRSGIGNLAVDNEGVRVVGNAVEMPAVSLLFDLNGRPVDNRGLMPGVYIAVTPQSRVKVIIR